MSTSKQFNTNININSTNNIIGTTGGALYVAGGINAQNLNINNFCTIANLYIANTLLTTNGNNFVNSQWITIPTGIAYNNNVGIDTTTVQFNLDISGGTRISGGLTTGTLNVLTNANIPNININNLTVGNLFASTITTTNLNSTTLTSNSLVSTNITTTNISINSLFIDQSQFTCISSTNELQILNGTGGTYFYANSSIGNSLNIGGFNSNSGAEQNFQIGTSAVSVSIGTFIGTNTTTNSLLTTTLGSTNILCTNLTTTNIASTTCTIPNFINTNITVSSLIATTSVSSGNIFSTNITTTNIVIQNLSTPSLTLTNTLNANFNSNTIGSIFTTGGNVGINTTSPSSSLYVNGNVGSNHFYLLYSNSAQTILQTSDNLTSASFYIDSSDNLNLRQSNNNDMYFQSRQNINFYSSITASNRMIINCSPSISNSLITILTTINTSVNSNTIGNIFTTGGNVGINTTSPSNTLDVNGTCNITNFLTTGNINNTNISSTNIVATNATIQNYTITNVTATNLLSTTNLTSPNINSINSTNTNIISTNSSISNLISSFITTTNLLATQVSSTNLLCSNLTTSNIISINSSISNLNTTNFTTTNLLASTQVSFNNLNSVNLTSNSLISSVISNTNLNTSNITTTNLLATSNATFSNLNSTNITLNSLIASNITANSLIITDKLTVLNNSIMAFNSNTIGNIFTTGGNVGIGNTQPNFTLDINGNLNANTSISTTSFYSTNSTHTNLVSTHISTDNLIATSITSESILNTSNITCNNLNSLNISSSNLYTSSLVANTSIIDNFINTTYGNITISTTNPTVLFTGFNLSAISANLFGHVESDPTKNFFFNLRTATGSVGASSTLYSNGVTFTINITTGNVRLSHNTTGTFNVIFTVIRF